jgi:hypothetical protein
MNRAMKELVAVSAREGMQNAHRQRLNYLDIAVKKHGLSVGYPDADEISRYEHELGLPSSDQPPAPECRLSGTQAHYLVAMGQVAAARELLGGLQGVGDYSQHLDLPAPWGRTAIRAILPQPGQLALRVETRHLQPVDSYMLAIADVGRGVVTLAGWATREELLASPKTEVLVPGYGAAASPVRILESLRTVEVNGRR